MFPWDRGNLAKGSFKGEIATLTGRWAGKLAGYFGNLGIKGNEDPYISPERINDLSARMRKFLLGLEVLFEAWRKNGLIGARATTADCDSSGGANLEVIRPTGLVGDDLRRPRAPEGKWRQSHCRRRHSQM